MLKKVEKKDLCYLGTDAQAKIAKAMIEDMKILTSVVNVIEANYFTEPSIRYIMGLFLEYYKKKGITPSYEGLKIMVKSRNLSEIDRDEYLRVIDEIKETTTENIEIILDEVLTFCKQQKLTAIANKIFEGLKKNGYDPKKAVKYANEIMEIENITMDEEEHNPFKVMEEVLSEDREERIPTGIPQLDDLFNGGLSKGSLACLQANAGCGKTTLSCIFASRAAAKGYKVLQIYFEDRRQDMDRKHYAVITPHSVNTFIHPRDKQSLINEINSSEGIESIEENLLLLKMPTGVKTVEDIQRSIRRIINKGFQPDMVIIDYFDCIKASSNPTKSQWEAETSCMRKLENLAQQNHIALWVMQQGNRSGEKEKGGTTVQGAYTKKQIASIYVTVSRQQSEQEKNLATITVDKNRQGRLATFIDCKLDNGNMELDMRNTLDDILNYIYER